MFSTAIAGKAGGQIEAWLRTPLGTGLITGQIPSEVFVDLAFGVKV
jgi:hypothetical protein